MADLVTGPEAPAPARDEPGAKRQPSGNRPAPVAPAVQTAPHEGGGCTQAQLRRFIKSRPYVPMHELRRRFELNGETDEVSAIPTADGTVYVGLPVRESAFIAELTRQGEIGLELCHDPSVPMVVGVFATRPIAR
jgi:hypothetical protein